MLTFQSTPRNIGRRFDLSYVDIDSKTYFWKILAGEAELCPTLY